MPPPLSHEQPDAGPYLLGDLGGLQLGLPLLCRDGLLARRAHRLLSPPCGHGHQISSRGCPRPVHSVGTGNAPVMAARATSQARCRGQVWFFQGVLGLSCKKPPTGGHPRTAQQLLLCQCARSRLRDDLVFCQSIAGNAFTHSRAKTTPDFCVGYVSHKVVKLACNTTAGFRVTESWVRLGRVGNTNLR